MEKRFWYPGCRFALPWAMIALGFQPVFVSSHDSARRDVACYVSWYNRFVNQLYVDGVWRRCTQRLYGLLTIYYTLSVNSLTRANIILYMRLERIIWRGVYRKKVPFLDTLLGVRKRALQHPCLAGHTPAFHPVRAVGTQRVALDRDRMRLRVKPARTQRVRRLGMVQDWPKVKTYWKVAVLLAKQAG